MKTRTVGLVSGFCLLAIFSIVGIAGASPMTWDDLIVWDDMKLNARNQRVSYMHDITGGADGFDPSLDGDSTFDTAVDYSLTVSLHDDNDSRPEAVFVNQPGSFGDTFQSSYWNWTDEVTGWSIAGLVEINLFGHLDVTVAKKWGDFYIDKSYLVVNGYTSTSTSTSSTNAPIPEPSILLLVGVGLAGIVGTRIRRKTRKVSEEL